MTSVGALQTLPPFEELVELAKHNPLAFDMFKQDMCEELILSASEAMQQRLWAQQSHIDLIVSRCKNPDHANIELMKALSSQVEKFQHVLCNHATVEENESSAQVIPFPQGQQKTRNVRL